MVVGGGYWGYHHLDTLEQFISFSDKEETIETFETSIQPDELLSHQAQNLLLSKQHVWGPVRLYFSPHLFLQVKYSASGRATVNTAMLWDLIDGELVLNTNNFDRTQGFADCLNSKASADDFRLLHLLFKRGGSLSKEQMVNDLGMADETVCERVDSLKKRHLVVVSNDVVRIHVESPLLKVEPISTITKPVVHRKTTRSMLFPSTFKKTEIESLIQNAFGSDLAIRSSRIIYIPIYEVQVLNPDESLRKTYWNAISGQQLWKTSQAPFTG
jgi:hypothetical protein